MFAPAYVGRKRRAKPIQRFYSLSESIRRIHIRPTYAGANMGHPDWFRLALDYSCLAQDCSLSPNKFVISTGVYPDFLPRRKSGESSGEICGLPLLSSLHFESRYFAHLCFDLFRRLNTQRLEFPRIERDIVTQLQQR
jgi:hypothetical protein